MSVRRRMLASMASSAKNHDLPLPRPPYAPRYRAGCSSGSNTAGVAISRLDNAPHYLMDDGVICLPANVQRLRRLAVQPVAQFLQGRQVAV